VECLATDCDVCLVSSDRKPKQPLAFGERKSLVSDRVILVPGPDRDVQVVRTIYQMLIGEELSIYAIARALNAHGIKYQNDRRWTHHTVAEVLTNPKYAGFHVYGRTSSRLYTPSVKVAKSEWILTPRAFGSIVDHATVLKAQQVLSYRTTSLSDEELLNRLKRLLARAGRLSLRLIQKSENVPSSSTYRQRFGSLRCAYQMIGYGHPAQFGPIDLRRRTQALREELIGRIAANFPDDVSIVQPGGRWRNRLRLQNGSFVSVLVGRTIRVWKNTLRWQIDPIRHECGYITLLARLDLENRSFFDFYVLPNIDRLRRFHISETDPWLRQGVRLDDAAGLLIGVQAVCQ
jgi:Recombinase